MLNVYGCIVHKCSTKRAKGSGFCPKHKKAHKGGIRMSRPRPVAAPVEAEAIEDGPEAQVQSEKVWEGDVGYESV